MICIRRVLFVFRIQHSKQPFQLPSRGPFLCHKGPSGCSFIIFYVSLSIRCKKGGGGACLLMCVFPAGILYFCKFWWVELPTYHFPRVLAAWLKVVQLSYVLLGRMVTVLKYFLLFCSFGQGRASGEPAHRVDEGRGKFSRRETLSGSLIPFSSGEAYLMCLQNFSIWRPQFCTEEVLYEPG